MISYVALHNTGIIPTLETINSGLADTAFAQNLNITAVLQADTLLFSPRDITCLQNNDAESTALILPLLHDIKQLTDDMGLAAIDEALCGGLHMLRAEHPQIKWIPVGQFTTQQLEDYMKSSDICAVCDTSFIHMNSSQWDNRCVQIRNIALGYHFAHVGIHDENAADCSATVNILRNAFGFPIFDIGSSVIVAGSLEVTKSNPQNTCGHIGIETASVARAINDLESKGFTFEESTLQYQVDGRPISVYLDLMFHNFKIHLLQKR